jgi:hypothetical protein
MPVCHQHGFALLGTYVCINVQPIRDPEIVICINGLSNEYSSNVITTCTPGTFEAAYHAGHDGGCHYVEWNTSI